SQTARQTKRSEVCISAHFVRFPDCQFVDCAERLRHENGKMIYSPFVWVVLWGVNGVVVFFVG
ncbi:hypothetical protein AET95_00005, partial [Salmonella enterica subsp. enterica serovar Heidelberg]|uniref:hypothetical protein n=1 Tax=Salmonella enterica TaxID=28901 RepID=UPI0006A41F16